MNVQRPDAHAGSTRSNAPELSLNYARTIAATLPKEFACEADGIIERTPVGRQAPSIYSPSLPAQAAEELYTVFRRCGVFPPADRRSGQLADGTPTPEGALPEPRPHWPTDSLSRVDPSADRHRPTMTEAHAHSYLTRVPQSVEEHLLVIFRGLTWNGATRADRTEGVYRLLGLHGVKPTADIRGGILLDGTVVALRRAAEREGDAEELERPATAALHAEARVALNAAARRSSTVPPPAGHEPFVCKPSDEQDYFRPIMTFQRASTYLDKIPFEDRAAAAQSLSDIFRSQSWLGASREDRTQAVYDLFRPFDVSPITDVRGGYLRDGTEADEGLSELFTRYGYRRQQPWITEANAAKRRRISEAQPNGPPLPITSPTYIRKAHAREQLLAHRRSFITAHRNAKAARQQAEKARLPKEEADRQTHCTTVRDTLNRIAAEQVIVPQVVAIAPEANGVKLETANGVKTEPADSRLHDEQLQAQQPALARSYLRDEAAAELRAMAVHRAQMIKLFTDLTTVTSLPAFHAVLEKMPHSYAPHRTNEDIQLHWTAAQQYKSRLIKETLTARKRLRDTLHHLPLANAGCETPGLHEKIDDIVRDIVDANSRLTPNERTLAEAFLEAYECDDRVELSAAGKRLRNILRQSAC